MTSYLVFAKKEGREIVHTWRVWVLPSIVLFFAISSPIVARFTPEIIAAVGGAGLDQLVLPTPTYSDAYGGWIKNLSQITLFAIIVIYGGVISSELRSGTAILVLTKPVSRTAFVVVKVAVNCVFLTVVLGVGTLVTWLMTIAVFDVTASSAPSISNALSLSNALWLSSALWLVLAIFYIAAMTILSVAIGSAAGASGAGVGVFVGLSIATIIAPLNDYSPAGLPGLAASAAATGTVPATAFWPVATSLAISVLLVAGAAALLRRKEL